MIKYKKVSKNIQYIIFDNPKTPNSLTWIHINNAEKNEIEYLRKNYNFNLNHLKAARANTTAQRQSIEQGSGYLFLIMHFPVFHNGQITPKEIDFFISDGYLVTMHNDDVSALNDFFSLCKKDGPSCLTYELESSSALLYEILEKLILGCYPILDQNSIEISKIEETIFTHEQKDAVSKILSLRHSVINFRKIMQNHKNILKKLMEMNSILILDDNTKIYYKNLIEHTKTIWEILENQKEVIGVLYDTNESLLTYKLNDIMKTLTIFSVILIPLTLLGSIFGMNTVSGMPFMETRNGFWIIITIMLSISSGMLVFFKRKKWF
ncbi:MAG: magnesium transporter CorA family protein [Patescibacteria group bacterium]